MAARYDLHTHSAHSDGTTTPEEIAAHAATVGLSGFALTDHDTTAGWDQGRAGAARAGIAFLPGMELTTRHDGRSTHLLAYGLDPGHEPLTRALERVRESRLGRAREMVRRISRDFPIEWASVGTDDDARTIGRPHIADALVAAGFFADRGAAFADVLHPRSPYYVPTYALDTLDAIGLVREAGGLTVLAHPAAGRQSRPLSPDSIDTLVRAGLWGLELDHPENRAEWIPELEAFAAARGLRITGASDYHGAGKANRLGECASGADIWEELVARAAVPR